MKGLAAEKMRRKIIHLAREMGWNTIEGKTIKADMPRINAWCVKFGYGHKELNEYSYKELPRLVSQMELVYHHYISNL